MAKWVTNKFREIAEVNLFLVGGIRGGIPIDGFAQNIASGNGTAVAPVLVGKTLIFTTPAKTVTFAAGADPGGRLTAKEIVAQILAVGGLAVTLFEGRLFISEASPSTGTVLSNTGTANALLGFDTAVASSGKVYGTPFGGAPTAPYLGIAYSSNDNMHVLMTYE